jgi:MinD superfamily P-loop ATPase
LKEIVLLSGKGGTGKTSLTAAFAVLQKESVAADCDVDGADMHLLLSPTIDERHAFHSGQQVRFRRGLCSACGKCVELCSFNAISATGPGNGLIPWTPKLAPFACEGCGLCAHFCPEEACVIEEALAGEWYISNTRSGPLVHARLNPGFGNSGKLAAHVKERARALAKEKGYDYLLVDGPPGVGCPVIASLSGASYVVLVTEPTQSSLHDVMRVFELTKHFSIPTAIVINKADLHQPLSRELKSWASHNEIHYLGHISYDKNMTKAQVVGKTIVEYEAESTQTKEVKAIWQNLRQLIA